VQPWASVASSQEADYKLFPQNRAPVPYTEIDTRPLTRGDAQSRALAAASWRQNGIMSANEIRGDEGLDDAGPDADELLVQSNMTTVEHILEPPAPPALPPGAPAPADDEGGANPDETDEDADQPSTFNMARLALVSAVGSALERYRGRLQNQQARKDRSFKVDAFRTAQAQVLAFELRLFNVFSVKVIGREITAVDMARAAELFENGLHPETIVEHHLKQLPG
jgi:hypothetical protein